MKKFKTLSIGYVVGSGNGTAKDAADYYYRHGVVPDNNTQRFTSSFRSLIEDEVFERVGRIYIEGKPYDEVRYRGV